jgi:signal transduction histidine kinase
LSLRRVLQVASLAAVVGGLYALGALLPFWYLTGEMGAAFFPAAGVTFAVLALTDRRLWPIWLAAVFVAEFTVDVTHGIRSSMAVGFALANTLEPLVGVSTVRWLMPRHGRSLRGGLYSFVAGGAGAGPFVGAFVGAATIAIYTPANPLSVFGNWWLGDALGVIVVATPILAWARGSRYEQQAPIVEIVALSVLAVAVLVVPGVVWQRPMLYLVLPLLMWAALRGGTRAASTVGFVAAMATAWVTVTGRADQILLPGAQSQNLLFVQLYLGATLLSALVLCIEIARRRRAEIILRSTESDRIRAESDRIRAELLAATAAGNERHRIARETHDIIGHALNVILLQAGAARRFLGTDPERSRELLESLEATGREAFGALDIALGISEPSPLQPEQGLEAVPDLVQTMRNAGLEIELEWSGPSCNRSTLVEWSAYRILQEALTNVVKHAPSATVTVQIRTAPEALELSVVSRDGTNGNGANGNGTNGNGANGERHGRGLIGKRERVAELGGEIDAGPESGGFAVHVRLPTQATRP